MSDLQNLLLNGGGAGLRKVIKQSEAAGSLFSDATWDQVGSNQELTDFLHKSLDPTGSKYSGDSEALKQDILNTTTARGSSVLASVWDYGKSVGEGVQSRRFQNLVSRLYESAPNRLLSGNLNDTYQAIKSGLIGGVVYDAPLLLTTYGIGNALGLGAKGLGTAGKAMLADSAAGLVAREAGGEAVEAAAKQLVSDVGFEGLKRGAIREGAENAAFGAAGDIAQQGAGINRESQDGFSLAQVGLNAVGGGLIGGTMGAIGGRSEGRALGRELAESLPGTALEKQFDNLAPGGSWETGASGSPGADKDFVTLADAHANAKSNLSSAANEVDYFMNGVVSGAVKSRYTPDQLGAIRSALVEARGSSELSEALKNQANALRATGEPNSIAKALELEQRATAYESLIKHIDTIDFSEADAILRGGDVSPELVAGLSNFNPDLAAALGKQVEKSAGKTAPTAPTSTPAQKPNVSAESATPEAAAPESVSAEMKAAPAPEAASKNPTASDISGMAETAFSEEEKSAFKTLTESIEKAGIDLQTALDNMASDGIGEVSAKIANASGGDRGAVRDSMSKVVAAAQREHAKAVEVPAAAAKPAEKTAAEAPEVEALAAKIDDAAIEQQQMLNQVADMQASADALKVSADRHSEIHSTLNKQREAVEAELVKVFEDVSSRGDTAEAKLANAQALLDGLMKDHPEMAPLLSEISAKSLTTERGLNKARALLKTTTDNAIAWTYTKAIGDVLPDALNTQDFDVVLRSLLRKVPGGDSEATRIVDYYKGRVYDALMKRGNAIGFDNLKRDPILGKAWESIVDGMGKFSPVGGRAGLDVDVAQIINDQASPLLAKLRAEDGNLADAFSKALTNVGKSVREQFRQLKDSGIKMDSQFAEEALRIRAADAVDEVLNGVFETLNKGDFEKLAKLRELREGEYTIQSPLRSMNGIIENPVMHRVVDGLGIERFKMLSGRSLVRPGGFGQTVPGKVQGALSDGISDYIGTLWAHPRRAYSASVMARNAIWGAAVDNASWGRGKLRINGVEVSGSMKELKGLYKESMNQRIEQARMDLILDAAERRRLDSTDKRYLGADEFKARIESIGSRGRRVTDSELAIAELYLDSQERIMANTTVARKKMSEILAASDGMSPKAADQIAAIMGNLDAISKSSNDNLVRAMSGGDIKADSAAVARGRAKENGVKGSAEKSTTKERAEGDAAKAQQLKITEFPDGKVAAVTPGYRDQSPVILSVSGVKYEFIPAEHIKLDSDGFVTLFDRKVGTWKAGKDGRSAIIEAAGFPGEEIKDLTQMARKALVKNYPTDFSANVGKLTKAKVQELADGAQIDKAMSETAAIREAMNEIATPSAATPADLDRTISSYAVPDGRVLVIKDTATGRIQKPGKTQGGLTLRDFAAAVRTKSEDIQLGTIPAGNMSRAGKATGLSAQEQMLASFIAYGRDTGKVNDELVKAIAAQSRETSPLLVKAQRGQITSAEAAKIKVGDSTLDAIIDKFDADTLALEYSSIASKSDYDALLASLTDTAAKIESIAPHGVKRPNASRRQSFAWLQAHMSTYSEAEKTAALDILRRLDADRGGLPYFEKAKDGASGDAFVVSGGKSSIKLSDSSTYHGLLPKHVAVVHEVGHWAFMNMLSPSEKLQFISSLGKYYDADGRLDVNSLRAKGPLAQVAKVEKALGRSFLGADVQTNELFAWQFSNWFFQKAVGSAGAGAEETLWKSVVSKVKAVIQHFLGQKVDPDLVPLFERIMPSTPSEKKFEYSALFDVSTGEPVKPETVSKSADRNKVGGVVEIMERIDSLRGRLGQQLFTAGGVIDSGFAEDLRAAASHMFGLLYGKDERMWGDNKGRYLASKTVGDLRKKLNPTRGGKPLTGAIDPRELFSRNDTGRLMQAIRDVVPESSDAGDLVAFEAAANSETFSATLKASGQRDMPDVEFTYNQAMEQEFKRQVAAGVRETDALDAADIFAAKEAASYAKEAYGIDIESSLFDASGARSVLGTDAQRAALGSVARKLHDLMGDALDHLQTEVESFGFSLKRSERSIAKTELGTEAEAIGQKVAKSAKAPKKRAPNPSPATQRSAAVAEREASERVDGQADGTPVAAPPLVKALIARVPHRDQEQADIIGTMMYRVFSSAFGEEMDNLTNAQIAKLAGMELEEGVNPGAMASTGTQAFEQLRKSFRLASEELTNGNKNPMEAVDFVIDMLANVRRDALNEEFQSVKVSVDGVTPSISSKSIADAVKTIARGRELKGDLANEMAGALYEILGDATDILAGLGKTANAKKVLGESVSVRSGAVRLADGSMHPMFAKTAVEARLSSLPRKVADAIVEMNGGGELRDIVGFVGSDKKRIFMTADEMVARANKNEMVSEIDGEIARALSSNDGAMVDALVAKRDALMSELGEAGDGVTPITYPASSIYDPVMATDVEKLAITKQLQTGASEQQALVNLGYAGKREGDVVSMFKAKDVKDLEAQIKKATKEVRLSGEEDVPTVGEIFLNMTFEEGQKVDPLAAEQRALQAGATESVAKVFSRLFKKNRNAEGLTADEAAAVKTFHGLQLSSNSDRIMKAGGKWLANLISPVEGTGFDEAFKTKLSTSLTPLMQGLDKIAGVNSWYKKAGYEIWRNLDMRKLSIPQSDSELRMAMAMRTGDISKLSIEERKYVGQLKDHFKSLLKMQRDAGIDVGDVTDLTNEFYLPQRFNLDWIRANREEAIEKLGKWFEKDRAGSPYMNDAMADARRVINEAINKEELQGIVDGASSVYTQAFGDKLHSRKLHIVGKDWENMADMFDNNIRSLVTSYTEAAHKRVEWSDRFGIRGHAAATYVEIASTGYKAAIEALMGKAQGLKRVIEDEAGEVEGVSSLFNATAKDEFEASRLVHEIVTRLDQGDNDVARNELVNLLVDRHVANGGFGADHFRKRAQAIVNGLGDFGEDGRGVSEHEMDFMRKTVGVLGGRPAYTINANQGVRNAAGAVKMFNSVTLLSGAVLASLGDPAMSLIRSGSIESWMKGTRSAVRLAMGDPATAEAMARVGVGMESILNENITHVNGGISGRISNAFFQANMLTPWTTAMRQAAALTGFESIKANQIIAQRERFSGNMDSWKYRKSMRYLRQLGLAHLVDEPKLDTFASAVGDQKVAEAIHKFTNESVFQPNRNDMPLWTQDPIASVFWQFKAYPTMMGRLVKRKFADAVAFEDGKYAGDPMGLMYLMTIGAAAGAGSMYVKDVAYGKNQEAADGNWRSVRERTLSQMAQEFGFKDFDLGAPGADAVLGTYAQGLLSLGALGFLGDLMFQSAKSVDNGAFGRERIMSQIAGPTLGTFMDTIQLVEGAQDALTAEDSEYGSSKARNAVRKVAKRAPFIGGQDPWVEAFVNDVAGEAEPK